MRYRVLFLCFFIGILLLIPVAVEAATLYLSPSGGSHNIGDSFSVALGVNTEGEAINAAQATVSFPNDILDVTSVSQVGIFTLWPVTPTFSNATGTVTFAGGIPSQGYTGSAGTIM